MSYGVHPLAKKISESEYSIFGTMLMVTACIPTLPLQMVFAQQTAGALANDRQRQLAGMIRLGWLWTFVLWAAAALMVLIFQKHIADRWQLTSLADFVGDAGGGADEFVDAGLFGRAARDGRIFSGWAGRTSSAAAGGLPWRR